MAELEYLAGLATKYNLPGWLILALVIGWLARRQLRELVAGLQTTTDKVVSARLEQQTDLREHRQREETDKLQSQLKQQSWFDEQLLEMLNRSQAKLQDDVLELLKEIQAEQKEQKYRLVRNNDLLTALNMNVSSINERLRPISPEEPKLMRRRDLEKRSPNPEMAITQPIKPPIQE